jgi:hypothetical protein
VTDEKSLRDQVAELSRELRSREHDRLNTILENSEEATLKAAENSIRIVLLINGGAAVSVLAFAGSLASKDRVTTDQLSAVAEGLLWFAWGVGSSALTSFLSYLTNISYLFANAAKLRQPAFPYVVKTPQSDVRLIIGRIFHGLALLAGLASLVLFVIGMYEVKDAIRHLK